MDNGLVCRWMTGQAKISPKISAYYSKPSNQEKLAHTIHQNLLPLMSDCNMAIQDIYTLFIQDDSISDAKKKNLTPLYKPASSRLLFLAKLISFGMERQFIKRNTKNQKLLAGGALSPIVLDYIMDSEVPKPCQSRWTLPHERSSRSCKRTHGKNYPASSRNTIPMTVWIMPKYKKPLEPFI